MTKKQIQFDNLLFEVNSSKGDTVSLINSSGLFSHTTIYGAFSPSTTDTILSIPEEIEDGDGVKYCVTEIRESVFDNNETLQEVRIPRSVTRIEWGFWECLNLKSIVVDPGNPAYCAVDGVLYTKDGSALIAYPNKHGKEYKVKEGTRIIEHFAFKNTDIVGLYVPSSLQEIRTNAFYRCSLLRYVSAREIKWPIRVAPMVGDYGNVNPLFHYTYFSVCMNSPLHGQRFCDVLPASGTIVKTLQNGQSLVKIKHDNDEYYGVCDKQKNWLIKPLCSDISVLLNTFFEASFLPCFFKSRDRNDSNDCEKIVLLFDSNGERFYKKQLIELSESLLLYDQTGQGFDFSAHRKGTLYSSEGTIILDNVEGYREIDGYIFFAANGKIGLYDIKGKVIIPPEYDSLENISFCPYNTSSPNGRYKEYVTDNVFDTNVHSNIDKVSIEKYIIIRKGTEPIFSKGGILIGGIWSFSFQCPFILKAERHYLFSLQTGIVQNSAFDGIYPISERWYVVKEGQKYGIFDIDSQSLLVPFLYDRIQYQGGDVILVCKDGLWGALSFGERDCENGSRVFIPTEYYEIKILDKYYSLFGVKMKAEYWDKVEFRYTILDAKGEEYMKMHVFRDLDSQFSFYTEERVLTSRNKKYGFISVNGYVTIPFKYDNIYSRDDGTFNISVENRWGVLSPEGSEIVPVKYQHVGAYNKEQIDKRLAESTARSMYNRIVVDAESEGVGVLNRDGSELIPPKYEYILDDGDIFYYTQKRHGRISECEDENNWFCSDYWGALDSVGKEITKPIYKCFDRRDKWLLAATYADLDYDYQGNPIYIHRVYDLYNLETRRKVFGGIKGIEYTDSPDVVLICIPVVRYSYDADDNIILSPWSWAWDNYDRWLVVDTEKLQSIIPTASGSRYQFNIGEDIHCIYRKGVEGNHEYSHPQELFLQECPKVFANYTIIRQNNHSYLVSNKSGWKSSSFISLLHIESDCFFTHDGDFFGIIIDGKEVVAIDEHFVMLTRICKGYCFGAREINDKNAEVMLLHCTPDGYNRTTIISKISLRTLASLLWDNRLRLSVGEEDGQLYVKDNSFFDSSHLDLFIADNNLFANDEQEGHSLYKSWFASKNRLLNAETYDDWE